MSDKYIYGIKGIAQFFGLSLSLTIKLIQGNGIPGVRKLRRQGSDTFSGGGRGVWTLSRDLAEQYRHTRSKTPLYDPVRATEALVKRFEGTGCRNIPELIKAGYIDDTDWCNELNRQREISNLHVPILMHPLDLQAWATGKPLELTPENLYPNTTQIFKKFRKRK